MAEALGGILRLPARKTGGRGGFDWSPVEAKLGATLPQDYKRFIDSYGAGLIDDHVTVCAPNEPRDWAELLQHNAYAHECVRLDFGGPDNDSRGWHLGDSLQWEPRREDVPSWFDPGDNLISWGHTGNGDLLFGTSSPAWPPTTGQWSSRRKDRTGSSTSPAFRRHSSAY